MSVFSVSGYKNASTEEIARKSGISKGLLFHYFESKRELFIYLYNYCIDFLRKRITFEEREKKPDYFDFLFEAQEKKREVMKTHPYIFAFSSMVYYDTAPEISSLVKSTNREIIAAQIDFLLGYSDCSRFKKSVDPRKVTEIIIWTADGMMKDIMSRTEFDIDSASEEYLEVLRIFKNNFYEKEQTDGDNQH